MRQEATMPKRKREDPETEAITAVDLASNIWSVAMAAKWSGIPYRTLLRMCQQGRCPCIPIGEGGSQKWPKAENGRRRRSCFKFMVPRVSFMRWFESIGRPEVGGVVSAA
jgi:hypothetical protein